MSRYRRQENLIQRTLELTLRRGSTELKIKCGRRRVQRIVEQAGVAGGGNVAPGPTVDSAVLSYIYGVSFTEGVTRQIQARDHLVSE